MVKCCNKEMIISNSPYAADGRAKKRDEIGKPWCSVCGEYGGKADNEINYTMRLDHTPLPDTLSWSYKELIGRIKARYGNATPVIAVSSYKHTPQEYLKMCRRLVQAYYSVDSVQFIGNGRLKVTITGFGTSEYIVSASDVEAGLFKSLSTTIIA